MGILSIDTNNPDLFKSFEPIPPGSYTFEVANDLKIEDSNSSDNKVIKIELVVIDDGEYKGRKVFDNLVVASNPEVKRKTEWKIAHFAFACGVATSKEDLNNLDLDEFKGCACEAKIGVKTENYEGEQKIKNLVKQYYYEAPEED